MRGNKHQWCANLAASTTSNQLGDKEFSPGLNVHTDNLQSLPPPIDIVIDAGLSLVGSAVGIAIAVVDVDMSIAVSMPTDLGLVLVTMATIKTPASSIANRKLGRQHPGV